MTRRRRRRSWSESEKREICRQTMVPGVSVSQVARRYDVNANLVFKWLKDRRFGPAAERDVAEAVFLPIEVIADGARAVEATPDAGPVIEVRLPTGVAMTIRGAFDPDAVARLVRGLGA